MRQWLNQHGERPLLWLAAAFVLAVVLRRVFFHSETAHWGPQAAFAIDHAYQAVCGFWLWRYAGRHCWLWLALGCPPFGCFSCWSGQGALEWRV